MRCITIVITKDLEIETPFQKISLDHQCVLKTFFYYTTTLVCPKYSWRQFIQSRGEVEEEEQEAAALRKWICVLVIIPSPDY